MAKCSAKTALPIWLLAVTPHRGEDEIIALVLESVRQFARAGEAQDDNDGILLARLRLNHEGRRSKTQRERAACQRDY